MINVDETWLSETSFVSKVWAARDSKGNAKLNSVAPRVSLIVAMDTEGQVWFTSSHANTDSNTFTLFLYHLKHELERECPNFLEDTYFLLDNASYHSSEETQATIKTLGFKVVYTGPYSYSACPIEMLFRNLK